MQGCGLANRPWARATGRPADDLRAPSSRATLCRNDIPVLSGRAREDFLARFFGQCGGLRCRHGRLARRLADRFLALPCQHGMRTAGFRSAAQLETAASKPCALTGARLAPASRCRASRNLLKGWPSLVPCPYLPRPRLIDGDSWPARRRQPSRSSRQAVGEWGHVSGWHEGVPWST